MKPSSGRARRAATFAASTLCGVAFMVLAGPAVHAQVTAVADGTPQIDAAITQKDWAGALKQLDERIAANPRDVQAKFKRGTVLARLNRDDEAIAAFTELTQAFPELPEPYNNLAALFAKEGRLPEARTALETATRVNPNYGLAWENLGDVYLRLAAESYRRAQSTGHASATTQQRLADIQKIVSPPKNRKPAPKPVAAVDDSAARATPNVTENPSFQFGGATGSLAIPPYAAPSK
jgi:Flp pilus assembly protein TadD